MGSKKGVMDFCHWARQRFGKDGARKYIRSDLYEEDEQLRDRMVDEHFAVWAEFMVYYAKHRVLNNG